ITESYTGIARTPANEHLEVKVRAGAQTRGADVADRVCDLNARANVNAFRKAAHVAIAGDKAVGVTDFDQVAVAVAPSGTDECPVADSANRRAHRGSVIHAEVLLQHAENRVHAHAERARYTAEL